MTAQETATREAQLDRRRRAALAAPAALLVVPGLLLCAGLATAGTALGHVVPVFGGPAFAIVLGMLLSPFRALRAPVAAGARLASGRLLQASVVVLGTQLSLHDVVRTGISSLPVMLGTLGLALVGARVFGRLLRVDGDLRTLIGVGTAVCGASAIAAVTRVVTAAETDVAYALSTIFAFNVVAVLLYPPLGHLMGMSQHSFGLWGGTAINDTSSVVAATTTYGHAAANYGVVVKLTRALMILPISGWLALRHRTRVSGGEGATSRPSWIRVVPWFIGYFLIAVLLDTIGWIPTAWHPSLAAAATFLICVALAGIGLSARFAEMRRSGVRPLLLGAALWLTVGVSSLGLQALTHA